jgi:hypothetical protein
MGSQSGWQGQGDLGCSPSVAAASRVTIGLAAVLAEAPLWFGGGGRKSEHVQKFTVASLQHATRPLSDRYSSMQPGIVQAWIRGGRALRPEVSKIWPEETGREASRVGAGEA